jgi:GT2 family glycosyltransferase
MSNRKSVSIVIPNYNGVPLLEKYLPDTCRAIENANVEYEVIIVDDCSTDASVAWIRESFPEVVLLVNSVNSGFSVTCNRGIKVAKNELILLLNTDVSLNKDYFETLWHYFDEEETFGVMGRIINSNGKTEDTARMLSFSGMKFKSTEFYYCDDQSKKTPTAYLSGANALVRREMLVRLGGFDEIFSPFYCEDVDLSFRAWKMGWKCYYEHGAICVHEVSKTIRSTSSKSKMLSTVYRNKFVLHAIHLNGGQLALWYCQMLLVDVLFRVLVGKLWILKSLKGFYYQRQAISNSREKLEVLMKRENQSQSLQDIKSRYFDPVRSWGIKMI